MNGLARELEVHWHRDQAGTHDAVIRGNKLSAIGGEDADAIPTRDAALRQGAGDAVRHVVDLAKRELARHLLAAEIDDRDLVEVAVAWNEIAEIGEDWHSSYKPDI